MIRLALDTPGIYFSYSYDLTHCLQRLHSVGPDFHRVRYDSDFHRVRHDTRLVLDTPGIYFSVSYELTHCLQRLLCRARLL